MANTPGIQASIGNGQTMNADAAIYWRLLVAAVAAACGVWVVATEGTRTYAKQLYLWQNRNRPGFNPAWHPDDARAYHLSGRAVDVGSQVGFVLTLVSIAFYKLSGLYGFRATVKGEPWHFEWRLEWVSPAIRAMVGTTPAAGPATPIPIPPVSEEDDMFTDAHARQLSDLVAMLALDKGPAGEGGIRQTLNVIYGHIAAQAGRFALVRKDGRAEVFLSVDRQELRWIKSEESLKDQRYTLRTLGASNADDPVQVVKNLDAYGTIIGDKPAGY